MCHGVLTPEQEAEAEAYEALIIEQDPADNRPLFDPETLDDATAEAVTRSWINRTW